MRLKTDQPLLRFSHGKENFADSLSAALLLDHDLFVASDEATSIERLTTRDGVTFGGHRSFELQDFIHLPAHGKGSAGGKKADQEVDVEGLDYHDGYLWLVGSHSIKRKRLKVDKDRDDEDKKSIIRLSETDAEGNRFILARIPLTAGDDTGEHDLRRSVESRSLEAAQLPCTMTGNSLTDAIAGKGRGEADPHLYPYLSIPGKDNGFDIEGLAVSGESIFLGLRGPVLRGWAVVLEIRVEADHSSVLRLKQIGPGKRPYKKHFLDLGGLGVRDLCIDGSDLLILAGPTMNLDGPVFIFRWKDGAQVKEESIVWGSELTSRIPVPYGEGTDHAEGMTLMADSSSVLIVYDSPGARRRLDGHTVRADVLRLR